MEKFIFDENNGLWYELHGDYYLPCLTLLEEEYKLVGIWGRRHHRYLKDQHRVLRDTLLMKGELNRYLAEVDQRAKHMLHQTIEEMVRCEGITELLKAENQMEWVGQINNIRIRAEEIVNHEVIFSLG